jgi:hypothetical protein
MDTSHSPFFSQPERLAGLLLQAVEGFGGVGHLAEIASPAAVAASWTHSHGLQKNLFFQAFYRLTLSGLPPIHRAHAARRACLAGGVASLAWWKFVLKTGSLTLWLKEGERGRRLGRIAYGESHALNESSHSNARVLQAIHITQAIVSGPVTGPGAIKPLSFVIANNEREASFGSGSKHESLILAQNERWRQA